MSHGEQWYTSVQYNCRTWTWDILSLCPCCIHSLSPLVFSSRVSWKKKVTISPITSFISFHDIREVEIKWNTDVDHVNIYVFPVFCSQLKSKVGNILNKDTTLRIKLNIDDCNPFTTKRRTRRHTSAAMTLELSRQDTSETEWFQLPVLVKALLPTSSLSLRTERGWMWGKSWRVTGRVFMMILYWDIPVILWQPSLAAVLVWKRGWWYLLHRTGMKPLILSLLYLSLSLLAKISKNVLEIERKTIPYILFYSTHERGV